MNTIEIIRGTTNNFRIRITDSTGAPYVPAVTDRAIFGIKKNRNDQKLIITKTTKVSEDGTAFFTLCPEDTTDLCCDKYYYDVGLESGADYFNIIPPTPFYISYNVTKKGCAEHEQ